MTGDQTYVTALPVCDYCKAHGRSEAAVYDGRTASGQWANMCQADFDLYGVGLGTGYGQRLIVGEPPEVTDDEVRRQVAIAVENGDWAAFEDAVGDRDPIEFL